ncbi:glycosyltransferase [Novosphingobium sp. FSY-8]|uniref:Glycosyltransferase n=1 Tax=Novosphingobium ovatum TaxID=1908523 RepID=A0ABW9XEI9_9SPHN|nr:glycosyltransferase [Novosphingobium ovatum]NBC36941.1 glycosyltransferase [Novosphingobium ovatum]
MNSMSSQMAAAFAQASPRHRRRAVPWISVVIGSIGPILFLILTAQAFLRSSIAGWAVGIVYILYDTFLLGFTARQIRSLIASENAATALPDDAPRPSLGVIIAARNEAPVLGITIDTLADQDGAPDLILLADDGSNDDSPAVMKALYGLEPPMLGTISPPSPVRPNLRWLRLPHGGKARALNAALPLIDTEVVVTLDADTLLAPGALKAMRDAFAAEPQLVAATGVLTPICGKSPMARAFQWFQSYEYVRNFLSRYAWMGQNALLLISGAFAGFRRDAVMEVGGFDDDCMVEDYELIHRLHRHAHDTCQDWTVRVIGHALASTDAPAGPMAFLRQRRRWFGGFLQTQRWNRDMVGNAAYGRLGTRMLPVKALDTVQPIYGMAAFLILIYLIATGRFYAAGPIIAIMLAKVAVDLTFHIWSIGIYKRWTGQTEGLDLGPALLASFVEPFCFQLLRHAGAIWGWVAFLQGGGSWGRMHRTALTARVEEAQAGA